MHFLRASNATSGADPDLVALYTLRLYRDPKLSLHLGGSEYFGIINLVVLSSLCWRCPFATKDSALFLL